MTAMYPEPGRGDGIAPAADGVETPGRRQPGARVSSSRMSRRCWSIASASRASISLAPIDACYELVGFDPHALARAIRRRGRVAGDLAPFSRLSRTCARPLEVEPCLTSSYRVIGWTPRPRADAAAALSGSRSRITPADETIHAVMPAGADPDSSRRSAAYSAAREAKSWQTFSARPDRWGQTLRNKLWAHSSCVGGRVCGERSRRFCRCPALTISTSPRPNTSTRWKAETFPCSFYSAARSFTRRRIGRLKSSASPGTKSPSFACRFRCGAR